MGAGLKAERAHALFVPAEVVRELVAQGAGHFNPEALWIMAVVVHERVAEDHDAVRQSASRRASDDVGASAAVPDVHPVERLEPAVDALYRTLIGDDHCDV